jgi:hypothetical protein
LDFVNFLFRASKVKDDINYIIYKFSYKFWKVCKWLNMYYSNIKITIFLNLITMSIWIILKNLVWTCRECNFYQYWTTVTCIYPIATTLSKCWVMNNKRNSSVDKQQKE